LEDLDTDGTVGLILKIKDMRRWVGFIWLRIGTGMCCSEHGNESSVSIKSVGILD
jgi:hypothetical protein